MAACCISRATCCISGFSETTSRMRWGICASSSFIWSAAPPRPLAWPISIRLPAFPMVGASGAISGVLAAYVLLYPRHRITVIVPLGIILYPLSITAIWVVGFWFLMQLISAALLRSGPAGHRLVGACGGFCGRSAAHADSEGARHAAVSRRHGAVRGSADRKKTVSAAGTAPALRSPGSTILFALLRGETLTWIGRAVMKHRNSHLLIGYWSRLRKGRSVPDQTAIDPRAIKRILSQSSSWMRKMRYARAIASPERRIATATEWNCEVPILVPAGISRAATTIAQLLRQSLATGQPICLSSLAESEGGMVEMETVLAPLSFAGKAPSRFIGISQFTGDPTALFGNPIVCERLVDSQFVQENEPLARPTVFSLRRLPNSGRWANRSTCGWWSIGNRHLSLLRKQTRRCGV